MVENLRQKGVVHLVSEDEAGDTVKRVVWGAEICPTCFEVRGALEVKRFDAGQTDARDEAAYEQLCQCQRALQQQETWPGFDFNKYLELCCCCGVEPITSGSRWSPFFCGECRERVVALNQEYGRWIIPLGRHTLMHGMEFDAAEMQDFFDTVDMVQELARTRVAQNVQALGFGTGQEIGLGHYVNAARERALGKQPAFDALRIHVLRERFGL